MAKTLSLSESHKVISELQKNLKKMPTKWSFTTTLDYSQLTHDNYKGRIRKKADKQYETITGNIDEYLSRYRDLIKLKTFVSNKNAEIGLNEILAKLSNMHYEVRIYNGILAELENPSYGMQNENEDTVYSAKALNQIFDNSKHEYDTIVAAPQFDGLLKTKSTYFTVYSVDQVKEILDNLTRDKTELEKKRDSLNLETTIEVQLSEATVKLCGL